MTLRLYECNCCGRRLPANQMLYSRHTGKRYCRFNVDACVARGRRRAKKQTAVA